MLDDTIAPIRYRTGQGDRAIPFALGMLSAVSLPLLAWAAGPFLWPWGVAALFLVGGGSAAAFRRWWNARETVLWSHDVLEFHRGGRSLSLDLSALTRVEVRPSAAHTLLEAGPSRWRLSHRLVRTDDLLDRLRIRRPDLFSLPDEGLVLRASSVSALIQVALAGGTAAAGWLLSHWLPWLGAAFVIAAAYTFWRVLWFIPHAYRIVPGVLTVRYWLRKKTWRKPRSFREDAYAAGGAVFFRIRFEFGNRIVVLDEGKLLDPLRPHASWIVSRLNASSDG